jgi:Fic family protein
MARCLQTLVLARGGLLEPTFCSIEEYLGRNTPAYYAVLAEVGQGAWHPDRSALPWLRFCLTAHYRQAVSAKRRLEHIARVGEEIERELARRGLPERAAVSLTNLVFGYRIRNESYRREADVLPLTASRDLKALTDAGLLLAKGERRARAYAAGEWLLSLRLERDRSPIPDPFDLVERPPSPTRKRKPSPPR